jgi:hypothetical protein
MLRRAADIRCAYDVGTRSPFPSCNPPVRPPHPRVHTFQSRFSESAHFKWAKSLKRDWNSQARRAGGRTHDGARTAFAIRAPSEKTWLSAPQQQARRARRARGTRRRRT